jgi:serine protease inhibitor
MIALPYRVTQRPGSTPKHISMLILKPKPGRSLKQLWESDSRAMGQPKTASEQLEIFLEDLDRIDPRMVKLKMPKFKFGKPTEVVSVLKDMGFGGMFQSGHGGFRNMLLGDASVSDVQHRAVVAVDEDGTEAAAATVVIIGRGMVMMPKNPTPMDLDEPFMFWIVETNSKMILFAGKVYEPVTE